MKLKDSVLDWLLLIPVCVHIFICKGWDVRALGYKDMHMYSPVYNKTGVNTIPHIIWFKLLMFKHRKNLPPLYYKGYANE